MRKVFLSTILLLIAMTSFAGGENTLKVIEGKIIDDSGDPAVGARVFLTDLNYETYTDFDGVFRFENVKTSTSQKLKVNYISHQELVLELNADVVDKESVIELFLESK